LIEKEEILSENELKQIKKSLDDIKKGRIIPIKNFKL
jgi:hypothetical protein